VTIVCVWNDAGVRSACLDASVEALRAQAPDTEYLPVDNASHTFTSAGAALNHGAAQARNEVVVFAHQDVWLHSIEALERAAGLLADDDSLGVLGSCGIAADGRIVGTIRDRVVVIGDPTAAPEDVDSMDEVLFMATRAQLLAEPLVTDPELAWHGYAVEYGLRMRSLGRRAAITHLPLTHNSLTTASTWRMPRSAADTRTGCRCRPPAE
jgi:hypothetical protein